MESYNLWPFVSVFFSLSIMFSRFVHEVAGISSSFGGVSAVLFQSMDIARFVYLFIR